MTWVPVFDAAGSEESSFPKQYVSFVPVLPSSIFVSIVKALTVHMLESASPLKPIVAIVFRSSISLILLVVCFCTERRASASVIPRPLSVTCI